MHFELHTNKDETNLVPRTCQCPLCKRHGASWISDPEGEAHIHYKDKENVSFYRFGTKTADFMTCKKCGVLMVAVCEIEDRKRCVLNIKAMQGYQFTSEPVLTNFDGENVDNRLERRGRNWTGKTVLHGA